MSCQEELWLKKYFLNQVSVASDQGITEATRIVPSRTTMDTLILSAVGNPVSIPQRMTRSGMVGSFVFYYFNYGCCF